MFLSAIPMAPQDSILGLNEQFAQDPRPDKLNLAVGVYYDDAGKIPLLSCVAEAEASLVASQLARGYQPIDGPTAFQDALLPVVFGTRASLPDAQRIATAQTVGGTSALRLAADFLRQWAGAEHALISEPTWDNHRGVLAGAGLKVGTYRYLESGSEAVDLEGMLADLSTAQPGAPAPWHLRRGHRTHLRGSAEPPEPAPRNRSHGTSVSNAGGGEESMTKPHLNWSYFRLSASAAVTRMTSKKRHVR